MVRRTVGRILRRLGVPTSPTVAAPERGGPEFDGWVDEIIDRVAPTYTMTTPERVNALCQAVAYLATNHIEGPIVECGVWRGGSMMAAALTLLRFGDRDRDLYLFDTFAGMTTPTSVDVDEDGLSAEELLRYQPRIAYASLGEVRGNLRSTGYPRSRMHFVAGPVEQTLPGEAPGAAALVRLDTDWYESTKHELVHLVPRISRGGVLIVDDYGKWRGSRKAVDEYIAECGRPILLNRIDNEARIAVLF